MFGFEGTRVASGPWSGCPIAYATMQSAGASATPEASIVRKWATRGLTLAGHSNEDPAGALMSAGFATGVVDLQTTSRRQVANDYLRSLRTRVRASATFDQMPLSSVEAEGRPDVIAFHGAALVEEWEGAVNNPKWAPLRGGGCSWECGGCRDQFGAVHPVEWGWRWPSGRCLWRVPLGVIGG